MSDMGRKNYYRYIFLTRSINGALIKCLSTIKFENLNQLKTY